MEPTEYPFPSNLAVTNYCVFPSELEDNALVLFHAMPIINQATILKNGFRIPDPTGRTGLPSVSFAKQSSMALGHAIDRRNTTPGEYCIFAVRYNALDREGLQNNFSDIHDRTLDPAPVIIGYSIVPESYRHI